MNLTAADIEADFELFDMQTTATVTSFDPDAGASGGVLSAADVEVLQRSQEKTEPAVEEGGVPRTTCRIHLRASTLTAFVLKERDQIVLDGEDETWVVDKVSKVSFGTRYVCECHKLPE